MDKRRLLLIVVCSFATAYTLHIVSNRLRLSTHQSSAIDARVVTPASSVSPASRSLRPNYPYSVIPGGAYSAAELRSAVQRDALVNSHYADFNLKSARLVTLTDDRFQYVSYRLNNRIYWTRNKLRIPRGEVLLTDGYNFARTRCGNRLSFQPKQETAAAQPPTRLLSLPPFTPALLSKGEVTLAPPPVVDTPVPEGPDLPFDLPRLAPYLPGQEIAALPPEQIWSSVRSYPPSFIGALSGPPPLGLAPVGPGSGPITPGPGSVGNVPITPETPNGLHLGTPPVAPPILPIVPIPPGTPVPPVSTVPEPASLSLFAASLCGLLWLLTRVMRSDARTQN